jgi:four helix bundle protein
MASGYRQLDVYKKTFALGADIYGWVPNWPENEQEKIGDQLIRAIEAVGANIAEARGRSTKADRRRVLGIASGELQEVEHWLAVSELKRLIPAGSEDRACEIGRMIEGLIRNPGRR